jgi:hypothetical protein
MIHDHINIWLLRPGVGGFGELPSWLDDTDARSAAEQLGERWRPIDGAWRLEGSGLWDSDYCHELLGAVRLPNQLVMLFENNLVAIVESDRSFAVARIAFEVSWITSIKPPPDNSADYKSARTSRKQHYSYQPEVYFNQDWHHSGNRFATEAEAEAFVANLRATWIPQGFIKRDRVQIVREVPNAFLNWKTKQAEWFPEAGAEPSETDDNDERAA